MSDKNKHFPAKGCVPDRYCGLIGSPSDISSSQSFVFDNSVGKELAKCPYFKQVVFSRECSPTVQRRWNYCFLDKSHCGYSGRRLKFASYGVDSLKVIWVCPKVDSSFLGGAVQNSNVRTLGFEDSLGLVGQLFRSRVVVWSVCCLGKFVLASLPCGRFLFDKS